MAIPTKIESLSTTAASNGPAGSDDRSTADDGLRQAFAFVRQLVTQGSDIASASTITPPSTGSVFDVTGTTSITTIASTESWDGRLIALQFDGILTLTHSANLYLPAAANITTAAGDIALFVQRGTGAWKCVNYTGIAAAGSLTGATLAAGVTASSLTSFGASIVLGTPASGTLTNCTIPASALTGATLAAAVTASSLTSVAAAATVGGIEIGYRRAVTGSVTSGTIAAADSGKGIYATAGVTIPNATFAKGDIVTIYNTTAGALTITISTTTNYFNGASAGGSKSLAANGVCTVIFGSGTECILSGNLS